jgi:hypothetical protein
VGFADVPRRTRDEGARRPEDQDHPPWAKRGARPSAPQDQRTASADLVGASCPKAGKGAALVMPRCDAEAMNRRLAEIATQVAPGAHAALLVDQAGWRRSGGLIVPPNIALIPLPAECPDLNPQDNVWRFMRDTWLSNRVFKSFNDIVDHGYKLIEQPWRIMAIGIRDWACRSRSASPGMSQRHRTLV